MTVSFHPRDELHLAAPNPEHLTPRTDKIRGAVVHWADDIPEPHQPGVFWLGLQTAAMSGENVNHTEYGDIEYNAGVCESIAHPGNGSILAGRDPKWKGGHALSTSNVANNTLLGICVLGNELTPGVIQALEGAIYLAMLASDPEQHFVLEGHRELSNVGGIDTFCPGNELVAWVVAYREKHGLHRL